MMKVKIGILLDTFVILFYFLVIVPNFNINPIVSITLLFGYIAITVCKIKFELMQSPKEIIKDKGVDFVDEELLNEILSKYGKKENLFLPNEIVVHENIRNFVEQYSRLEFDEDTIDYDREEILNGEHKEKAFKGFYCIGVCIDFAVWVKKSNDDETIYVYDVDTTERFVPYASNIKYYIIMRYNEWQEFLNDISEESNT